MRSACGATSRSANARTFARTSDSVSSSAPAAFARTSMRSAYRNSRSHEAAGWHPSDDRSIDLMPLWGLAHELRIALALAFQRMLGRHDETAARSIELCRAQRPHGLG